MVEPLLLLVDNAQDYLSVCWPAMVYLSLLLKAVCLSWLFVVRVVVLLLGSLWARLPSACPAVMMGCCVYRVVGWSHGCGADGSKVMGWAALTEERAVRAGSCRLFSSFAVTG